MVVGLFHPHLPWYAPGEFFASFPASEAVLPLVPPDDLDAVPDEGRRLAARGAEVFARIRDSRKWAEAVAAYAANIAFADRLVGRLMDSLDESPHASNTVVVFASDDGGEELYDRRVNPHELTNLANRDDLGAIKLELRGLLPTRSAPPAPAKDNYDFDADAYTWVPLR